MPGTPAGANAVSPTQAMTPEQAHAWIGGTQSAPAKDPLASVHIGGASQTPLVSNPMTDIQSAGDSVHSDIAGTDESSGKSPLQRGIKATSDAASGVVNTVADVIPGGKAILGVASQALNAGTNVAGNIGNTLADLSQKIGLMSPEQRSKFDKANEDFANSSAGQKATNVAETLGNLGNIANTILGAEGGAQTIKSGVDAAPAVIDSAKSTAIDMATKVKDATTPKPEEVAAENTAKNAKAQTAVQDALRQTVGKYTRPSGLLNDMESKNGTNPVDVISSYPKGKAVPAIENGRVNPDEAIDYLKGKIGELSNIKNDAVFLNDAKISPQDFAKYNHDLIDAQKSWSSARKATAHTQMDKELGPIASTYKEGIPLAEVDKLKTEQTNLSKTYNNQGAKPFEYDTHGIVGKASRDLVEMHTDDAPTKELNKLIQSHYDAVDLLDSLRGKTPHGGQLARYAGRIGGEITGAIAGSTVGHPFIGAMAGRIGADMLDSALHSQFISNPLKRMIVEKMDGVEPAVKAKMLKYIDENSPDISELGEQQSPKGN